MLLTDAANFPIPLHRVFVISCNLGFVFFRMNLTLFCSSKKLSTEGESLGWGERLEKVCDP